MSQEDAEKEEHERYRLERLEQKRWVHQATTSAEAISRIADHAFNAEMAEEIAAQLKSLQDGRQLWERNGKKLKLDPIMEEGEWQPVIEDGQFKLDKDGEPILDPNAPPVMFDKEFKSKHGGFYAHSNPFTEFQLEILPFDGEVDTRKKVNQYFDSFSIHAKLKPDHNHVELTMDFSEPLIGAVEHLNEALKIAEMPKRKLVQTSKGKAVVGQIRPQAKRIALTGGDYEGPPSSAVELGVNMVIDTREGMPSDEEMRNLKIPESKSKLFERAMMFHADDLDRVIAAFERYAEKEKKAAQHPDIPPPGSSGKAKA